VVQFVADGDVLQCRRVAAKACERCRGSTPDPCEARAGHVAIRLERVARRAGSVGLRTATGVSLRSGWGRKGKESKR
jgi:hypothetical protein